MIRSMTGYGDAEVDTSAGRLRLELKTVNHRFFNANIKTPSGFDRFEKAMTDALRPFVARGHVTAYLSL
ncbi:MAG: YicC/YloC family endoribonuclease, partial [Longimicrobiales bacterium]